MKMFLIVAALAGCSAAAQGFAPGHYATMEAAAESALKESFALSDEYEYGGSIYRSLFKGDYRYMPPVTDKSPVKLDWISWPIPGWVVVASYHTHPCSDTDGAHFSGADQDTYSRLDIIGFMGDMCTGVIHRMEPPRMIAHLAARIHQLPVASKTSFNSAIYHGFAIDFEFKGKPAATSQEVCDLVRKERDDWIAQDQSHKMLEEQEVFTKIGDQNTHMTCVDFMARIFGSPLSTRDRSGDIR